MNEMNERKWKWNPEESYEVITVSGKVQRGGGGEEETSCNANKGHQRE